MIDENFIEFCCLDKLIERREAIQVGPNFYFQNMSNAENIFVSQTAVAKENITEEEELVEDFGDGYFAPYQQVFYQQVRDEDDVGGQVFHHKKHNEDG